VFSEWTSEIDASFARAVRDRLSEIGALGAERRLGPEQPWTAAAAVEQRLVEAVDSLLALEGGVARVMEETAGSEEPRRIFAAALVLGCAPGDAFADAAAATLRHPRPDVRAAAADALALARSPAVGTALIRFAEDAEPGACAAALEALGARRQASFASAVVLLGHPDVRVAVGAARCLGLVVEQQAAAAVLRRVLVHDPPDALAVAAAEGLVALGDPAGLAFVRGELEAESVTPSLADDVRVAYLRLLGLGGEAGDLELFFRSLESSPRDAAAVGWFGHPDLVEWLLGSLDAANEARRTGSRASNPGLSSPAAFEIAAAQALHRILGAAEGAGNAREVISVDGAAWRAAWGRARGRMAGGQKHRFGKPYAPEATLDELGGDAPAGGRADAALELAIVSRGRLRMETGDWVARQKAQLAGARGWLGVEGYPAGAFPGRRR
jgi:hypothetical protein